MVYEKQPVLLIAPGSSYSIRAVWALEISGYSYEIRHYNHIIGLGPTKRKYSIPGKVSVPLLIRDDGVTMGGWEIIELVNGLEKTRGRLFDNDKISEVKQWDRTGCDIMDYTRAEWIKNIRNDDDVLLGFVPAPLRLLRPIAMAIMRKGFGQFAAKYDEQGRAATCEKVREGLDRVRSGLRDNSSGYLMDEKFTYADIITAVSIVLMDPFDLPNTTLIPGMKKVKLVDEYPDVFEWAQTIVKKHYPFKEGNSYPTSI